MNGRNTQSTLHILKKKVPTRAQLTEHTTQLKKRTSPGDLVSSEVHLLAVRPHERIQKYRMLVNLHQTASMAVGDHVDFRNETPSSSLFKVMIRVQEILQILKKNAERLSTE